MLLTDMAEIRILHRQGLSVREIAQHTGHGPRTVREILDRRYLVLLCTTEDWDIP